MRRFHYQAINENLENVSGSLDAESSEAAIAQLESTGLRNVTIEDEVDLALDPTVYEAVEPTDKETKAEKTHTSAPAALTDFDFRTYGDSLSNLTSTGLPLESGLRALAEEVPSHRVARSLTDLSDRLDRGESLKDIFAGETAPEVPHALGRLFRAGLPPSQLSNIVSSFLQYSRQSAEIQRKIWTGLLYSMVLLLTMVVLVMLFFVFLIPDFKEIFSGFDTELPHLTIMIIDLSDFLIKYGAFMFGGFCVLILGIRLCVWKYPESSFRTRVFHSLPLVGEAFRNASLSSFCRLLSSLVEARVPMDLAVRVAGAGSRSPILESSCGKIADRIEIGASLREAARSELAIPARVLNLFRYTDHPIVFRDALRASGDAFEGESTIRVGLVSLIIEPLILCSIGTVMVVAIGGTLLPLIKLLNDLS